MAAITPSNIKKTSSSTVRSISVNLANFYAVEVLEHLLVGVEMLGKEFQVLVGKCERGLRRWESVEVGERMRRLLGKGVSGGSSVLSSGEGRRFLRGDIFGGRSVSQCASSESRVNDEARGHRVPPRPACGERGGGEGGLLKSPHPALRATFDSRLPSLSQAMLRIVQIGYPAYLSPHAGRGEEGVGLPAKIGRGDVVKRSRSWEERAKRGGVFNGSFSRWHYYAGLRARRPRVLVVSSNKLEQNTLRLMLEPQGYRVDVIQNREDLYAFFRCHKRVDAVVVSDDFKEAGFGFFLTYFRASPASGIKVSGVPRLVYLGGESDIPAEAMQFDAKLQHPFFTEEVLEAVRGSD